jgi:hypothetical protein
MDMAHTVFCLIPHHWTLEDLALNPCSGNSHAHLSRGQAAEFFSANTVDELREPSRKIKGVLRLKRSIAVRGLSCRVGETLCVALADSSSRDWALTMLWSIRLARPYRERHATVDAFSNSKH